MGVVLVMAHHAPRSKEGLLVDRATWASGNCAKPRYFKMYFVQIEVKNADNKIT